MTLEVKSQFFHKACEGRITVNVTIATGRLWVLSMMLTEKENQERFNLSFYPWLFVLMRLVFLLHSPFLYCIYYVFISYFIFNFANVLCFFFYSGSVYSRHVFWRATDMTGYIPLYRNNITSLIPANTTPVFLTSCESYFGVKCFECCGRSDLLSGLITCFSHWL